MTTPRIASAVALSIAFSVQTTSVFGGPTPAGMQPGLKVVPSVSSSGATLGAAADASKSLMDWLHGMALDGKIRGSFETQNDQIRSLLTNSGQPGVLALVEVERATNETGLVDLVGDRVQIIGAGTDPGMVAIAYAQQKTLRPLPKDGSRIDEDASFYFWVTREGEGLRFTTTPSSVIRIQVGHALQDKAYLASVNEQSPAQAMNAAVAYLESNLADAERKARLATLRQEAEQRQKNIDAVEKKLATELERQMRIQKASTILSVMAGVGTLATQIASFKTALGADAPATVDDAVSNTALLSIADKLLSESQASGTKLKIQNAEYRDRLSGTRIEILKVLRQSSYPVDGVPQLDRRQIQFD